MDFPKDIEGALWCVCEVSDRQEYNTIMFRVVAESAAAITPCNRSVTSTGKTMSTDP